MIGQILDPLGQQRHLDLAAARVSGLPLILLDDFVPTFGGSTLLLAISGACIAEAPRDATLGLSTFDFPEPRLVLEEHAQGAELRDALVGLEQRDHASLAHELDDSLGGAPRTS